MRPNDDTRSAAQVLIDQLVLHGVRHAFCMPGESYIAALAALHDAPIALTVCRQEGGAATMAEAVGKITGRPGICFVTRGPGECGRALAHRAPGFESDDSVRSPGFQALAQAKRLGAWAQHRVRGI